MPRCLLVYDISDDRARSRVADLCLDYGLDRIQYSAFCGLLSRNQQEELMLGIKRLLQRSGGNVQLYPLCANDWNTRQVLQIAAKGDSSGSR